VNLQISKTNKNTVHRVVIRYACLYSRLVKITVLV